MDTLEWLHKHLLKIAMWLFVLFFAVFLWVVVVPDGLKDAIKRFLNIGGPYDVLPTPRSMYVAPKEGPKDTSGNPQEVPFVAYVRSTNAYPYRVVQKGDRLYGIIHTDLINKTAASFMLYLKDENGYVGLSQRVPVYGVVTRPGYVSWNTTLGVHLIKPGPCWLEIRNDKETGEPREIYYARIPVICR